TLAGAPTGRRHHTGTWTGTSVMIWGGCLENECTSQASTGGLYDPVADSWTATSTVNAPSARAFHTAVWTGSQVIVWGGCLGGECQIEISTGGRYDPVANAWTAIGNQIEPSA